MTGGIFVLSPKAVTFIQIQHIPALAPPNLAGTWLQRRQPQTCGLSPRSTRPWGVSCAPVPNPFFYPGGSLPTEVSSLSTLHWTPQKEFWDLCQCIFQQIRTTNIDWPFPPLNVAPLFCSFYYYAHLSDEDTETQDSKMPGYFHFTSCVAWGDLVKHFVSQFHHS